jgi:hypothetical protein
MDVSALLRSHVPDSIPHAPNRSFFDTVTEPAVPPAPLVPADATPADDTPAVPPQSDAIPTPIAPTNTPTLEQETPQLDRSADESGGGGSLFLGGNEPGPEPVAPTAQPSQLQMGAITQPASASTERGQVAASSEPHPVPTLNDTLRESASAEPETVAETFTRAPIDSVARSISLNQKFRFINQLFNGNSSAYNQAIEEIDSLDNYGQALDLISYRYASQYVWDTNSDEVSELVEILKRRFT